MRQKIMKIFCLKYVGEDAKKNNDVVLIQIHIKCIFKNMNTINN